MARILRRRVVKPTRAPDKRVSPQEINQWLQLGLSTAKIAEVIGGALIPESEGKTKESEAIADLYARSQKGPAQREYERQLREGTQLPESPLTPQLAQPADMTFTLEEQGRVGPDETFSLEAVEGSREILYPPQTIPAPTESEVAESIQDRVDAKARRIYALSMRPNRGFEESPEEEIVFAPEGVNAPGGYVLDDETFTELGVAQSLQDRIDERAGEVLTRPERLADDRFRLQTSPSVGTLARPSDEDVENLANEIYRESFTGGQSGMSFKTAPEQAYQALSAGHQETLAGREFEEAQAIARKELGVIDRMEADWGAGWTGEPSQPQPPVQDVAVTWDEAQAQARVEVEEEDKQSELTQAEDDVTETGMVPSPSPPTPETKQLVISTLQGLYAAMRQAKTFEEGAALLGQLHDLVKPEGWTFEVLGYGMGKKRDQAYKTALKYLKRSSPENEKGYAKILAKQRADSRKRQDQIDKEGRGETRKIATEARKLASDIAKEERQFKKFKKENKIRVEGTKTAIRLRARLRPGRRGRQPMQDKLAFDAFKLVTRAGMEEAAWKGEKEKREKKRAALGPNADPDVIEAQETAIAEAEVRLERATAKRVEAERAGNAFLGRTPATPKASTPPKPPTSGGTVRKPATEFF